MSLPVESSADESVLIECSQARMQRLCLVATEYGREWNEEELNQQLQGTVKHNVLLVH